jgi:hypothetical protein
MSKLSFPWLLGVSVYDTPSFVIGVTKLVSAISIESLPGFHNEVTNLFVTESRPGFRGFYKLGL